MGLPVLSDFGTCQSVRNQNAVGREKRNNFKKGFGYINDGRGFAEWFGRQHVR